MTRELARQLRFFSVLGVTHLRIPQEKVSRPEAASLEGIREEIGDCRRCKLCKTRTNIVFGEGSPQASLMFVGEAPGADEDAQGRPFVGRAGRLLTRIIEAIDLKREHVFIANILKCRPPDNRNPEADEVEACHRFLLAQIDVVRPRILVALGKYAAQTLLQTDTPISHLRGRFFEYRGGLLMPTYHPSYLLRTPSAKRQVWEDMQAVRDRLREDGDGGKAREAVTDS